MERSEGGIETELLDLSRSTLVDLEGPEGFASATERLLHLVDAPATVGNSSTAGTGRPC